MGANARQIKIRPHLLIDTSFREDYAMTEEEKIESYIATCKCCLLAQVMRTCPLCRFNIGLAERVEFVAHAPQPAQEHIMIFVMSE